MCIQQSFLPSLPLKSVTKVCVHLQSQHLFRDGQCMRITISHKDCYAGSILTGLRDTRPGHTPTHSSFGSQGAIPLCKSSHAPWWSNHTQKLTLSQRPHTGLPIHISHLPRMPSSHLHGSHLSIMNSNFISSMRFYSSFLHSELTPPSFVPKVTITDLAPYSCHWEL